MHDRLLSCGADTTLGEGRSTQGTPVALAFRPSDVQVLFPNLSSLENDT